MVVLRKTELAWDTTPYQMLHSSLRVGLNLLPVTSEPKIYSDSEYGSSKLFGNVRVFQSTWRHIPEDINIYQKLPRSTRLRASTPGSACVSTGMWRLYIRRIYIQTDVSEEPNV